VWLSNLAAISKHQEITYVILRSFGNVGVSFCSLSFKPHAWYFMYDPKFAVQTLDTALSNGFKSMCSIANHEVIWKFCGMYYNLTFKPSIQYFLV
jgi:hypothetical protein